MEEMPLRTGSVVSKDSHRLESPSCLLFLAWDVNSQLFWPSCLLASGFPAVMGMDSLSPWNFRPQINPSFYKLAYSWCFITATETLTETSVTGERNTFYMISLMCRVHTHKHIYTYITWKTQGSLRGGDHQENEGRGREGNVGSKYEWNTCMRMSLWSPLWCILAKT